MQKLFSLGKLYVSDFLKPDEQPRHPPVELNLMMNDYGAVHLEKTAPRDTMWGKYWYRSGINTTMKNELKNIVESITSVIKLKENDLWIDVAANDGTLLSFVPKHLIKIGIDPADDSFKHESEKHANLIIQDYFSADVFKKCKFGGLKAKILTSIAMFYDIEHPQTFIKGVYDVLDDDGLWVLQLSYSPLMLEQLAFDNILHEHFYYYSLFNIKKLFEDNGFQIMDCQLNDVNGGSFRLYCMKKNANIKKFSTQPYRDVCNFRISSLLEYENKLKLDRVEIWHDFFNKIEKLKEQTVSFIKKEKENGKTIWGYGASTKCNTLLQYFGLDNTLIDAFAERSTYKWGLRTVGTNIPIVSEEQMRKAKPDYLLLGPWHFVAEFKERESEYLTAGGKFIIACPKFEIIGS